MKVYSAIGTVYHTLEQARSAVSQVASSYDEVGIVVAELDKVEEKEL